MTATAKTRRHEAPEIGAMAGRMFNALVRRAAEGDTEALEQLQQLEQLAARALTAGLAAAHESAGYSWAELAAVTGTSRQNLSQRVLRMWLPACGHVTCTGRRRRRERMSESEHIAAGEFADHLCGGDCPDWHWDEPTEVTQ